MAHALAGLSTIQTSSQTNDSQSDDEFEEVESPFKPQSLEGMTEAPKGMSKAELKAKKDQERAEAKAAKDAEKAAAKAAKDAEEAEKKEMERQAVEAEKQRILAASQASNQATPDLQTIHMEIKALGDKLMTIPNMDKTQKQAIVNGCIQKVNGPAGTPPSTYPLELAVPFKNFLEQEINALFSNPPMQGLV